MRHCLSRPGEKLYEEVWYADENVGPAEQELRARIQMILRHASHRQFVGEGAFPGNI